MEDQPDGPLRERGLPLAYGVDRLARQVGLDQPALAVDRLLQRPPRAATARPPHAPHRSRPRRRAAVSGRPRPAPPARRRGRSLLAGHPSRAPPPRPAPAGAPAASPAPTPAGPAPAPEPLPAETPAPAHRPISPEAPLRVLVVGRLVRRAPGLRHRPLRRHQPQPHLSAGLPPLLRAAQPLPHQLAPAPAPDDVRQPAPGGGGLHPGGQRLRQHPPGGGRALMMQTPAWQTEYGRRAGELMDEAGARGARLYWVGLPVLRDARRNATAADANAAVAAAAAERPWVRFVDIWALFADARGALRHLPPQRHRRGDPGPPGRRNPPHPRRHPPGSPPWCTRSCSGTGASPDPAAPWRPTEQDLSVGSATLRPVPHGLLWARRGEWGISAAGGEERGVP